ncbi:hypothetical protein AVEN_102703-1, partial [Araneus ventricosus]
VSHDAPTFRPLQQYGAGKKHLPPDIALNAGETILFPWLITLPSSIADHVSANAAIFQQRIRSATGQLAPSTGGV